MKRICPSCEKETSVDTIMRREPVNVRGEEIVVDVAYFHCNECGVDFENTRGPDSLALAYREYRRNHGMLQPEDIREWRKQTGLTQRELSMLLGWGDATLSRYENGSLQVEAHEKILRLAMEPHNLLKLIREVPEAIDASKRDRLISELSAVDAEACSFERLIENQFREYAPDEFTGYRKFDLAKLFNAIVFFCGTAPVKTKLNKLLFYADFRHFKEFTIGITGARYVHLPYGPVPDNYHHYFASLVHKGDLEISEVMMGQYSGEICRATRRPDLSVFSETEIAVLNQVREHFRNFDASKISNFSHAERGYVETDNSQAISYRYASFLQI